MATVTVITRAKGRPVLLLRAAHSLARQRFRDFVWIVADDSGGTDAIEAALAVVRNAGVAVRVVRVTASKGMESASNQALALAESDLVTFLDDDDSWEPDFLAETTAFLSNRPQFAGVCTQTSIVEETGDAEPATLRKYVMNAELEAIQIADMMVFNHLTTNSLVYRRVVHETLGFYREDLPVMGDWEFGLRLVTAHDIGVIAKPLANYHRRMGDTCAAYANTVTAKRNLHAETDARIRNGLLRREWAEGRTGPGHLMALARIRLRADSMNENRGHAPHMDLHRGSLAGSVGLSIALRLEALAKCFSPRWWLHRFAGRHG